MPRIISGEQAPQHLPTLRAWCTAEWGKLDSFEGNHPGVSIPAPLLALETCGTLQGGLAFSTFELPEPGNVRVWINAVYVAPEHRGKNIASALIKAAEQRANAHDICELFVYTQLPALYQKLGWHLAQQKGADCVLRKALPGSQNR